MFELIAKGLQSEIFSPRTLNLVFASQLVFFCNIHDTFVLSMQINGHYHVLLLEIKKIKVVIYPPTVIFQFQYKLMVLQDLIWNCCPT
jgi:hypothetical protein